MSRSEGIETLCDHVRWKVGDFIGRWVSVRLGAWIEGPLR